MRVLHWRIFRKYFNKEVKFPNLPHLNQFFFYFANSNIFPVNNMSSEIENNKKRSIENEESKNTLPRNKMLKTEPTVKEKNVVTKTLNDYFTSSQRKPQKIDTSSNPNFKCDEECKTAIKEDSDIGSVSTKSEASHDKMEQGASIKEHTINHLEEPEKETCKGLYGKVKTIITWNVNSITVRYKNKQKWQEFMKFFKEVNPDVVCFQEVRLPAMAPANAKNKSDVERVRSVVKNTDPKSQADSIIVDEILKKEFNDYNYYFSLANIKYSGQLMLIKKTVEVKSIRFNFSFESDPNIHHEEGRIIIAEFPNFFLLSTYTPNNGFEMPKFERRRLFDEELQKFVTFIKDIKKKTLIWTGDLNIAPENIDLSHPEEFRRMKKGNVPKEHVGQPGCTDFERTNFQKILNAGNLVDAYRHFENLRKQKENDTKTGRRNINDNIYTWRCAFNLGKQHNKAMRIDHYIVSKEFLSYIDRVHIQGYGVDHTNFYGSDHCPVILYLKDDENEKCENNEAKI